MLVNCVLVLVNNLRVLTACVNGCIDVNISPWKKLISFPMGLFDISFGPLPWMTPGWPGGRNKRPLKVVLGWDNNLAHEGDLPVR